MKKNDKRFKTEVRGTKKFTADEILQFLHESGKVDLSYVQEEIEMQDRKKLLAMHPYKITQGKDGYWRTYITSDDEKRKLIKKKNKKDIEDTIVEYYKLQEETSFMCWFDSWKQKQIRYEVADNTVARYERDYRRFFAGTDFEKSDIRKLTEEDITAFMIHTIKKLDLKEKAGNALWGYISGVFKHARICRFIQENPCEYVEKKAYSRFYNRNHKSSEQRTINDNDLKLLLAELRRSQEAKPQYIPSYAVELAIYTGMRIGELSGLRWENVYRDKGYILINSSEKYNEKTKCWYMAETKTGKERRFPISDEIRLLLDRVKKAEMKYGYVGEFVFQNENGQVNTRSIAHCIRYRCKKAGIEEKCIHAVRRTFNSKMKLAGASSAVAASLLGHSERINENNYTYDISQMEYKKEIVSEVSKINAK